MTTDDQNESPPPAEAVTPDGASSSPEPSAFIKFLTQPWEESSPSAHAITYVLSALIIVGAMVAVIR